jgi:exonuclease III
MPNQSSDIQVENETVEPYRGIMIFRTLQAGKIVTEDETTKEFPKQTFYATLTKGQLPEGHSGTKIFVSHDVEGVRAQLDAAAPGTGLIVDRDAQEAEAKQASGNK